jgi:hypothetical protein
MNINRSLTCLGVLAFGVGLAAVPVIAQSGHVLVPADQVRWAPAPPVLPAGAELAVLEGNPSEAGPVTMRLRLPAQYDIPAHWHSMAERVTVLSGSFHVGMGDKLDRNESQTLAPGGFVSLPAKMHHFAWTSAPTIVQISLEGPFDLYYVNPADNPQKSLTKK